MKQAFSLEDMVGVFHEPEKEKARRLLEILPDAGAREDFLSIYMKQELRLKKEKHIATTDSLTGLKNNREYWKTIDMQREFIKRGDYTKGNFTVLFADIDHFKRCNDTYGHPFGDAVLKLFGTYLKDEIRKTDIAFRYGGEEFAVILPDTGLQDAENLATRLVANLPIATNKIIRERLARLPDLIGQRTGACRLLLEEELRQYEMLHRNMIDGDYVLTMSMGGCDYRMSDQRQRESVHENADTALYEAKRSGRNRYVPFSNNMKNQ